MLHENPDLHINTMIQRDTQRPNVYTTPPKPGHLTVTRLRLNAASVDINVVIDTVK